MQLRDPNRVIGKRHPLTKTRDKGFTCTAKADWP